MKIVSVFWKDGKFYDAREIQRSGNLVEVCFDKFLNPENSGRYYNIPDFLVFDKGDEKIYHNAKWMCVKTSLRAYC